MCVVSMVYDEWNPKVPKDWRPTITPIVPFEPAIPNTAVPNSVDILAITQMTETASLRAEVAKLSAMIDEFRKAVEAAKFLDRVLKQPDCEDPEKAKLEERVTELERRLNAVTAALGSK